MFHHALLRRAIVRGVLFCSASCLLPLAVRAAEDPIQLRRGLSCFFDSATRLETVSTMCLSEAIGSFEGGTVDTNPSFLKHLAPKCNEWYPKTIFGIRSIAGGDKTGSTYGAYRYRRAEGGNGNITGGARLIVIDLARSDLDRTETQVIEAVEGMVLQTSGDQDIIFTYAGCPAFVDAYLAGRTPEVIGWYEKIAEHYGIPSIDFAKNAAAKIKEGKLDRDLYPSQKIAEFFPHTLTAPVEPGNAVDQALFDAFLDRAYAAKTDDRAEMVRELPLARLSASPLQQASIAPYELGEYGADWKEGDDAIASVPLFRHLLTSTKPGAVYAFTFKGSRCGWIDILAADAADLEYRVDNAPWKPVSAAEGKDLKEPIRRTHLPLVEGLDRNVEHRLEIRLAAEQPPLASDAAGLRIARLAAILVDGTYVDNPYKDMTPLERIDAIYAKMPPVKFDPPADRWKHIPKTMKKLRNGKTLKIVMLGDSIMGDTGSSQYEKLLERMYPNCKVERIMSLRGSTGCWWYKDENRVESYVLRHEPDLLMIGGISQRGDIDAIRSVIHQVRAKQNPEIMLITPVFGATSDPHNKNWTFEISDDPEDYRNKLRKLALEEHCEFVDLTGVVGRYIRESGSAYGWFMRDRVHANDRGFQIIGRHLVEYFRPKR